MGCPDDPGGGSIRSVPYGGFVDPRTRRLVTLLVLIGLIVAIVAAAFR